MGQDPSPPRPLANHLHRLGNNSFFLKLLRLKGTDAKTYTWAILVPETHVTLCDWCLSRKLLQGHTVESPTSASSGNSGLVVTLYITKVAISQTTKGSLELKVTGLTASCNGEETVLREAEVVAKSH